MPDPKSVDIKINVDVDCPIKENCPHVGEMRELQQSCINITGAKNYAERRVEELAQTRAALIAERDALQARIDAAIKFIHRNGHHGIPPIEDRILRTLLGMQLKDAGTSTADFERLADEIKPCPCCFRTGQPRNQPAAPGPEKARADELQDRINKAIKWGGLRTKDFHVWSGMARILDPARPD